MKLISLSIPPKLVNTKKVYSELDHPGSLLFVTSTLFEA